MSTFDERRANRLHKALAWFVKFGGTGVQQPKWLKEILHAEGLAATWTEEAKEKA